MDPWTSLFLPFFLLLARIGAFFAVLPLFSRQVVPMRVRAALALLTTAFFAVVRPGAISGADVHWVAATLLLSQEVLHGLALGLAVSIIFLAVRPSTESDTD